MNNLLGNLGFTPEEIKVTTEYLSKTKSYQVTLAKKIIPKVEMDYYISLIESNSFEKEYDSSDIKSWINSIGNRVTIMTYKGLTSITFKSS